MNVVFLMKKIKNAISRRKAGHILNLFNVFPALPRRTVSTLNLFATFLFTSLFTLLSVRRDLFTYTIHCLMFLPLDCGCSVFGPCFKGELRVRLAPFNRFKPSSKIFYRPFQGGTSFVDLLCFCSVLCLLYLCTRLFICALWSPAGKGLTSWHLFVVSTVTFPLVSWVKCGT